MVPTFLGSEQTFLNAQTPDKIIELEKIHDSGNRVQISFGIDWSLAPGGTLGVEFQDLAPALGPRRRSMQSDLFLGEGN